LVTFSVTSEFDPPAVVVWVSCFFETAAGGSPISG
jgi:hypothetical protein